MSLNNIIISKIIKQRSKKEVFLVFKIFIKIEKSI